jgi:hypothetical protein
MLDYQKSFRILDAMLDLGEVQQVVIDNRKWGFLIGG